MNTNLHTLTLKDLSVFHRQAAHSYWKVRKFLHPITGKIFDATPEDFSAELKRRKKLTAKK